MKRTIADTPYDMKVERHIQIPPGWHEYCPGFSVRALSSGGGSETSLKLNREMGFDQVPHPWSTLPFGDTVWRMRQINFTAASSGDPMPSIRITLFQGVIFKKDKVKGTEPPEANFSRSVRHNMDVLLTLKIVQRATNLSECPP